MRSTVTESVGVLYQWPLLVLLYEKFEPRPDWSWVGLGLELGLSRLWSHKKKEIGLACRRICAGVLLSLFAVRVEELTMEPQIRASLSCRTIRAAPNAAIINIVCSLKIEPKSRVGLG
jgi:hypothetical protein